MELSRVKYRQAWVHSAFQLACSGYCSGDLRWLMRCLHSSSNAHVCSCNDSSRVLQLLKVVERAIPIRWRQSCDREFRTATAASPTPTTPPRASSRASSLSTSPPSQPTTSITFLLSQPTIYSHPIRPTPDPSRPTRCNSPTLDSNSPSPLPPIQKRCPVPKSSQSQLRCSMDPIMGRYVLIMCRGR